MQDKVILDSCVIASIFFEDENSERAERAAMNYRLITLDLAIAEVSNVAWKRIILYNDSSEIILKALKKTIDFINSACDVIHLQDLHEAAFQIAIEDKITVYDSFFVAAAERENAPLLTMDRKLHEAIRKKRNVKLI